MKYLFSLLVVTSVLSESFCQTSDSIPTKIPSSTDTASVVRPANSGNMPIVNPENIPEQTTPDGLKNNSPAVPENPKKRKRK